MALDLKAFRDRNAQWYGDDPLEDVARDVYDRGGDKLRNGLDYDTWKKESGVQAQIDEEAAQQQQVLNQKSAQSHFENRGFLGDVASDIAGGLVDTGELGMRTIHGGMRLGRFEGWSAPEEATQAGIEGIQRYKEATPFLQENPENDGFFSRSLHQGIRSATQSIAANLPGAAAGAAIGSAVPVIGTAVGAVAGFATSALAQYGLAKYDETMEKGLKAGLSEEEVEPSAIRQGLYEGGFEFAGSLLEGLTMGAGKLVTAPAKQAAKLAIKDLFKTNFKTLAKRAAGVSGIEVGTELITAGAQAEEDRALGLGTQRFWEAAADAFGPSVVASIIFAGVGHANVKLAQGKIRKALEDPGYNQKAQDEYNALEQEYQTAQESGRAEEIQKRLKELYPKTRHAAVDEISRELQNYNPDVANVWTKSAREAIRRGQLISTDDNIMDLQDRIQTLREDPAPQAQTEADALQKQLDAIIKRPMPTSKEDLELERQYMGSVQQVTGGDQPQLRSALDTRVGDIDDALQAEEDYEIRREQMARHPFEAPPQSKPYSPELAGELQRTKGQPLGLPAPVRDFELRGAPEDVYSPYSPELAEKAPGTASQLPPGQGFELRGAPEDVASRYSPELAKKVKPSKAGLPGGQGFEIKKGETVQQKIQQFDTRIKNLSAHASQIAKQIEKVTSPEKKEKLQSRFQQLQDQIEKNRQQKLALETGAKTQGTTPSLPPGKSARESAEVFGKEASRVQSPVGKDLLKQRLAREEERMTSGAKAPLPPRTPKAGPLFKREVERPPIPSRSVREIDEAAHQAAASPKNDLAPPTPAQQKAGNYKKGHVNLHGLDISIENPKGSERSGVSPQGKKWSTTMKSHYGYIKGTKGKDKDHLDVFVGWEGEKSPNVYVVNQIDPKTRKFDEHKIMLGFPDKHFAERGYRENYDKNWSGFGSMAEFTVDEFKQWVKEGDTTKPAETPRLPLPVGKPTSLVRDENGFYLNPHHKEESGAYRPRNKVNVIYRNENADGTVTPSYGSLDVRAGGKFRLPNNVQPGAIIEFESDPYAVHHNRRQDTYHYQVESISNSGEVRLVPLKEEDFGRALKQTMETEHSKRARGADKPEENLEPGKLYDLEIKPPGHQRVTRIKNLTFEKAQGESYWFKGPKGNLEIFTREAIQGITRKEEATHDRQGEGGVPGKVGVGEKSGRPVQKEGPGGKEAGASGVLQGQEEEVATTASGVSKEPRPGFVEGTRNDLYYKDISDIDIKSLSPRQKVELLRDLGARIDDEGGIRHEGYILLSKGLGGVRSANEALKQIQENQRAHKEHDRWTSLTPQQKDEEGARKVLEKVDTTPNGKTLVVVCCGSDKVWTHNPDAPIRLPARDAYTGSFFKAQMAYAESVGGDYVILSAKHGYLRGNDKVTAYDTRFGQEQAVGLMTLATKSKEVKLGNYSKVVLLGGKEYRTRTQKLMEFMGIADRVEEPFANKGIGTQKSAMLKAAKEAPPAGEKSPAGKVPQSEAGPEGQAETGEKSPERMTYEYEGKPGEFRFVKTWEEGGHTFMDIKAPKELPKVYVDDKTLAAFAKATSVQSLSDHKKPSVKTFSLQGQLYVDLGGVSVGHGEGMYAERYGYRLVPVEEYPWRKIPTGGSPFYGPSRHEGEIIQHKGREYVLTDPVVVTTKASDEAFAKRKKDFEEDARERREYDKQNPSPRLQSIQEMLKAKGWQDLTQEKMEEISAHDLLDFVRAPFMARESGLEVDPDKEVVRRGKVLLEELGWPTDPKTEYRNIHTGTVESLSGLLAGQGYIYNISEDIRGMLSWSNLPTVIKHWEPHVGVNWPRIQRLERDLEGLMKLKNDNPGKKVVKDNLGRKIKIDEAIGAVEQEIATVKGEGKKNGQPDAAAKSSPGMETGTGGQPASPGPGSRKPHDASVKGSPASGISDLDETPTKIRPRTGKNGKLKVFGEEKIIHFGVKDALQKGLITPDEAAVIDGIMETFPEAWRDHFEPRFSEQQLAPTEEQAKKAGFNKTQHAKGNLQVESVLLAEKMGPLKEDAKHLAVMFKGSDVMDFVHEFGEFIHARVLTQGEITGIINPLYNEYRKSIKGTSEKRKERNEWFSDQFEKWWYDRQPMPEGLAGLFKKMLKAIKGIAARFKKVAKVSPQLDILFTDIITNGRDIKEKYYYTDAEILSKYIVGADPTRELVSAQGFSGNSKTFMSWDPSSLCPKQDGLIQFMTKQMDEAGLPVESLLDLDVLGGLYDQAIQNGIDVPCSYCYVEQARRKAIAYHLQGKSITGVNFAMAKQIYRTVPYKDRILNMPQETIDALNKRGGLRLFSFSDYIRGAHRAEVDTLLTHAEKRGLSVKAITKNPDFVEDFGDRGITINLSIDMAGEGMDWDKAAEFKKRYPNVKVRSVALNLDEVVQLAELSHAGIDNFVDIITPYHHDDKTTRIPDGYLDMGHGTTGGNQLTALSENRSDLNLPERLCCQVGGKCYSEPHEKQCAANCGNIAGNLSVPTRLTMPRGEGVKLSLREGEAPPTFYSQLERTLEKKLPGSGEGKALAKLIDGWANKGEFKREELEWSGIQEWLATQEGKVAKKDVLDFLKANRIEIREITKGTPDLSRHKLQWEHQTGDLHAGQWHARAGTERLGYEYLIQKDKQSGKYKLMSAYTNEHFRDRGWFDSLEAAQLSAQTRLPYDAEHSWVSRDTQYETEDLTTPGGKGYKELLLTLPDITLENAPRKIKKGHEDDYEQLSAQAEYVDEQIRQGGHTEERRAELERWRGKLEKHMESLTEPARRVQVAEPYKSGHWNEPNVLAHVRFNERTDADGKRVLFLEEVQSDWHQEGRKKGYRSGDVPATLEDLSLDQLKAVYQRLDGNGYATLEDEEVEDRDTLLEIMKANLEEWRDSDEKTDEIISFARGRANVDGVPNAPFKTSWSMLAMKRMIRYAAENGYDRIAWTTGEQQAERYDLGKHVDSIDAVKGDDGKWHLWGEKDGNQVFKREASGNDLPNLVGKELADKIISQKETHKTYSGLDLKVGGEGMKGFYDRILPAEVGRYIKKWQGKVGATKIDLASEASQEWVSGNMVMDYLGIPKDEQKNYWEQITYEERDELIRQYRERGADLLEVHSIDITDAMRNSVMQGQPLFRIDEAGDEDIDFAPASPQQRAAGREKIHALIKQRMDEISSEWEDVSVETIRDFTDLPSDISSKIIGSMIPEDADEVEFERLFNKILTRTEGLYRPKLKKVYIISSNCMTPQRAEQVLLHEVVGHHGFRAILGDRFNPFLREVAAVKGKEGLQQIADLYGFDLDTQIGRMRAAEEMIARMAEKNERPGFLKRLYAAVREALRKLGFQIKPSDNDIKALLVSARKALGNTQKMVRIDDGAVMLSSAKTINPDGTINVDALEGWVSQYTPFKNHAETYVEYMNKEDPSLKARWTEPYEGLYQITWWSKPKKMYYPPDVKYRKGPLTKQQKQDQGIESWDMVAEIWGNKDFNENDPETLLSLSVSEAVDKLQTKLQGTPAAAIDVVFGRNVDLRELRDSFRIPAWLAKTNQTVKKFFNRQNDRDKERARMYHGFLEGAQDALNLDKTGQDEFAKLAFGLENRKVVDELTYVKVGERELKKGSEVISVPVYKLNPAHYDALAEHLRKEKVDPAVAKAYVAVRKVLDQTWVMALDRLMEIRNLDPVLIQKFRTEMGRIQNYFPHNRYGNHHLRAIDPEAKPGEETRYRRHFNALNDRHAKYWYARNIDSILAELKKSHPGVEWDRMQWEVGRNQQLPEEVYDFPIPVDAMQQIVDAAVSSMPEEEGLKDALRRELSREISDTLKSRGFGSHMIGRKDIPGHETQDPMRVIHDHFAGFAGWLTKMNAAYDFGNMLRDIDARRTPNEYKWATKFVNDMLQNATQLDRFVDGVRTFFFVRYLGLNIKTAAVNLTQNLVAGIPRLSMDTGGAKAGRLFLEAANDLKLSVTRKGLAPAGKGRFTDSERAFLEDMFNEGWGQAQLVNEMRGKVSGPFKRQLAKAVQGAGLPMEMAERFNRMSLGLAAFRAARAGMVTGNRALKEFKLEPGQKASAEVAKRFAESVVNDAHFVYGKGNRPSFLRGTAAGKALSTSYTFRSFSHNLLSMWRWMLTDGDREGKKAFAYSLLAMISLGGLGAVPLYNSLAALIRQLFGEDVLGLGVRKALPKGMRDLAMYGAPSALGVNIGGSIGMELPVLDRMRVNQSLSGQIGTGIGELLGIPFAVLEDVTNSVDALRSGRPDRAVETAAPTFVKNILSGVRLATEGQTTVTGRPVNVPGEKGPRRISGTEALGKGLGFQPLSSSKAFDVHRSLEEVKSYRDQKQEELANRYASAKKSKDRQEMVRVRQEAREWNRRAVLEKRPEMKINLDRAVKAREKARQPMKQMRGLARDYRETFDM